MSTTGTSGTDSRSLSSERRRTSRRRLSDALLRLDVDHEQRLLEPGRAREHLALVVEHDRMPVEEKLVLAADGVDEGDVADVVSRASLEHLLSLHVLAHVERRGGDVDEELRAGERKVGRGRAGLPDVLADGRADQGFAVCEEEEVAARGEVAVLVEDAVVGEEPLVVDRLHLAVGANGAAVVEVAVEVRHPDERDDASRLLRDLGEGLLRGVDEARPQEQVFRRVARDRKLGEEDDVGAGVTRLGHTRQDQLAVSVEIADGRVDLGQREPHRF